MIPADLSVEYPLVKLPYDCAVKGDLYIILTFIFFKRIQVFQEKCRKRNEFCLKFNHQIEK